MASAIPAAGWTEVLVLVPSGWEELVADLLGEASGTTVAFGRLNRVQDLPPQGFEWVRTALPPDAANTPADVERRLAELARRLEEPELADLRVSLREIPPEDWANAWKKTWKPFRVGRLAVVAPHDDRLLRPDDLALVLVPGGTFGTGRHATTRACLRLAHELVAPGDRVLDAGTGTGILSVAAALLGARDCFGFDVDDASRPAAVGLATRNGVADRCRFATGDFGLLGERDTAFDGVFANLYSDLLQRHARDLRERLRPGGWYVFSGCPEEHLEATAEAVRAAGLPEGELRRNGRWCTISGRKPLFEGGRSARSSDGI